MLSRADEWLVDELLVTLAVRFLEAAIPEPDYIEEAAEEPSGLGLSGTHQEG